MVYFMNITAQANPGFGKPSSRGNTNLVTGTPLERDNPELVRVAMALDEITSRLVSGVGALRERLDPIMRTKSQPDATTTGSVAMDSSYAQRIMNNVDELEKAAEMLGDIYHRVQI
jgi:hypothetical protein